MLVEAPFTHLHAAPVLQPLPGVPAGVTVIRGLGAALTVWVALTWLAARTAVSLPLRRQAAPRAGRAGALEAGHLRVPALAFPARPFCPGLPVSFGMFFVNTGTMTGDTFRTTLPL